MSLPDVVSRDQWLEARRRLLAQEKEMTRSRDELNASRRRLPMVEVDKNYVFEGPDGPVTLAELFGGKRQLIVQHVMFGPDWDKPCPGCSATIDELSPGVIEHVGSREVVYSGLSLAGASGAPTGAGCPGEVTSHSRRVPSAAATASSVRSGLRLTDWTTPAESISRAADGEPADSSRLAVA